MASSWISYDKKEDLKNLKTEISYPYEASNFSRVTKICEDKKELFKHLLCRDELKPVTQIITAGLNPELFISENSFLIISHFMRFKRYGMQYLYPGGQQETPNIVLQCFDIIQNVLDKDESDRIRAQKEKNKRDSNSKRTR